MQVSIESIGDLGYRLTVCVPNQVITEEVEKEFARVSKHASLPGFRKGQVPKKILQERYLPGLRMEIIEKQIDKTIPAAIEQEKLDIVGSPVLENVENAPDQDLRYVLTVEVRPEVNLISFADIQVAQSVVDIADSDVSAVLDDIRKEKGQWHAVEGRTIVEKGDRLEISWTDLDDDGHVKGDTESSAIELSDMVPVEVRDALIGRAIGDAVDIRFRTLHARVDVNVIQEKRPLSDTELLTQFGDRFENFDALVAEVRSSLKQATDKRIQEDQEELVLDALIEKHVIAMPPKLLEREIAAIQKQDKKMDLAAAEEMGKKRLTMAFVMSAVMKKYDLTIDRNAVTRHARDYERYMQERGQKRMSDDARNSLIARLEHQEMLSTVLKTVLKEAVLLPTPVTYVDFMKEVEAKQAKNAPESMEHHEEHVHDEHCHHDHD